MQVNQLLNKWLVENNQTEQIWLNQEGNGYFAIVNGDGFVKFVTRENQPFRYQGSTTSQFASIEQALDWLKKNNFTFYDKYVLKESTNRVTSEKEVEMAMNGNRDYEYDNKKLIKYLVKAYGMNKEEAIKRINNYFDELHNLKYISLDDMEKQYSKELEIGGKIEGIGTEKKIISSSGSTIAIYAKVREKNFAFSSRDSKNWVLLEGASLPALIYKMSLPAAFEYIKQLVKDGEENGIEIMYKLQDKYRLSEDEALMIIDEYEMKNKIKFDETDHYVPSLYDQKIS